MNSQPHSWVVSAGSPPPLLPAPLNPHPAPPLCSSHCVQQLQYYVIMQGMCMQALMQLSLHYKLLHVPTLNKKPRARVCVCVRVLPVTLRATPPIPGRVSGQQRGRETAAWPSLSGMDRVKPLLRLRLGLCARYLRRQCRAAVSSFLPVSCRSLRVALRLLRRCAAAVTLLRHCLPLKTQGTDVLQQLAIC